VAPVRPVRPRAGLCRAAAAASQCLRQLIDRPLHPAGRRLRSDISPAITAT
jgi:hypothetical protein